MIATLFSLLQVNFFISLPVLVIVAVGQWVVQFRLIFEHSVSVKNGLLCIFFSQLSAFFLSFFIWLSWPLDTGLILYHDRISIPAVVAEMIAIPFWLRYFGYFSPSR